MQPDIPIGKLVSALLAISFGTIIEWYDFTVYTQMTATIQKVFFPPTASAAVQLLSYWGIFAVGFVTRPIGALAFGHLGDTRGRGTCLLLSVIFMGVPKVIISCLPTYAQAGAVAPALLALMRLIQGLAMGGEFGAAMVYLHEIALPDYKTVTGSLGFVSLGVGVVIGICVVASVIYTVPADAMLVWGWRVPFLVAIVTLVAAILLRYNMPESKKSLMSREQIAEEEERKARAAMQQQAITEMDVDLACDLADAEDVTKNVEDGSAHPKHYVPLLVLFRGYWAAMLLQVVYEAWLGAGFYLGYSWLPSFFVKHAGVSQPMSMWMTLSGMVLYTFVVPLAGWISDKGVGRVTATLVATVVATATSIPIFLGFATKSLALCWVLQAATLALAAYTMALLPAICSNLYPAGVRISGFNFACNVGMMVFGGLTPFFMTLIQTNTGSIYLGPGIWMTCMGVITILSCCVMLKTHPITNRDK